MSVLFLFLKRCRSRIYAEVLLLLSDVLASVWTLMFVLFGT